MVSRLVKLVSLGLVIFGALAYKPIDNRIVYRRVHKEFIRNISTIGESPANPDDAPTNLQWQYFCNLAGIRYDGRKKPRPSELEMRGYLIGEGILLNERGRRFEIK